MTASLVWAGLSCAVATPAFADEPAATTAASSELEELQKQVEASSTAYDDALAKANDMQAKLDENQAKIDDIEAKLPAQREKAANAVRALYKLNQATPGVVGLILSSDNFNQVITTLEYLDVIQSRNTQDLKQLASMEDQLQQIKAEMVSQKSQADADLAQATDALAKAQELREQAQQKAIAEAAAQAAAAQEAAAAAAAANGGSFTTESGATANVAVPASNAATAIDWNVDKSAFISTWAGRIDAYLAGSPLAGEGNAFATAAWTYGVDPRWSPAISNTESSKGAAIPNAGGHNAWGWTDGRGGYRIFGSWDEAINAHVRYLGAMYGYTITPTAAATYCPPTWQEWYATTLAEMESI